MGIRVETTLRLKQVTALLPSYATYCLPLGHVALDIFPFSESTFFVKVAGSNLIVIYLLMECYSTDTYTSDICCPHVFVVFLFVVPMCCGVFIAVAFLYHVLCPEPL